jgi:hypothetical protein
MIGYTVMSLIDSKFLTENEALSYLSISLRDNIFYKEGKETYSKYRKTGKRPIIGTVKVSRLFSLEENMTEQSIILFCAYCGVRSYVGLQPYKRMNNDIFLSRMFGFEKVEEYRQNIEKLPKYKQKYLGRYQLSKIKDDLEESFGVSIYGIRMRGFYISTKLDEKQLGNFAEGNRKAKKRKELARAKMDIYNSHNKAQ